MGLRAGVCAARVRCDMETRQFQKHFTIEEARAMLPRVRVLFRQLHGARDRVLKLDEELGRTVRMECVDLGGDKVKSLVHGIGEISMAVQSIQHLRVQVKDFDRGLVDFPTIRNGHEALFCWELKEQDIGFWHDLETGFGGREPL